MIKWYFGKLETLFSQAPLLDSELPINHCISLYHNKAIIYIHNLSEVTTPRSNIMGNIHSLEETPVGSLKGETEGKDSRKPTSKQHPPCQSQAHSDLTSHPLLNGSFYHILYKLHDSYGNLIFLRGS